MFLIFFSRKFLQFLSRLLLYKIFQKYTFEIFFFSLNQSLFDLSISSIFFVRFKNSFLLIVDLISKLNIPLSLHPIVSLTLLLNYMLHFAYTVFIQVLQLVYNNIYIMTFGLCLCYYKVIINHTKCSLMCIYT